MFKRGISLVLTIGIMASLFTACGTEKTTESTTTAVDSSVVAVASETKEAEKTPATLVIWKSDKESDDFTEAQEQKFKDEHPWITLNTVFHDAEGSEDLMVAIAAGNAPSAIEISYPQMYRYIYAGALQPLNEYLDKWDDFKNYDKSMVDFWKYNDNYYGVPRTQYVMGLYYNRALLKAANVTAPTSWDELVSAAKKLTVPEKQQYGFNLLVSQWTEWWFEYFVWQAGGDLTKRNEDGTLTTTFTDPAVVTAAEFYRTLLKEKCIQPDLTMDFNAMAQSFASGKAAMTLGGSDSVSWFVSLGMKPEDIGFAPMIKGPSGKGLSQVGGAVYVIPKTDDKAVADAAFEFIDFYGSKDYMSGLYKNQESKGAVAVVQLARTDFKLSDIVKVDSEMQASVNAMTGNTSLEFYGKSVLGTVLDTAIQKSFFDIKSDITENFKAAEVEANKKIVPDFNASVKEGK